MKDKIMERYHQLREQAFESAFDLPEKFKHEHLQAYYVTMINFSKESISFMQDDLAYLLRLRDKCIDDLETSKLIWNNIQLTLECIKQEDEKIASFREEMKKCWNSNRLN